MAAPRAAWDRAGSMTTLSNPRVLLVDDSPDDRAMYADWFQRHGFCTLQAESAADAYWLASELRPAAVITDIGLAGGEDGLHLTRRLKADERMRKVPVVVLTGYVLTRAQAEAMQAGCDLFLPKPCLPEILSREIERLLRPQSCEDVSRAIRSPDRPPVNPD